jgi:ABC-type multidrug transport system permease subunit
MSTHADHSGPAEKCPTCGTPKSFGVKRPSFWRLGKVEFFCLNMAFLTALIVSGLMVLAGVMSIVKGNIISGLANILIGAPVTYGLGLTIGLAIEWAEQKKSSVE